MLTILDFIRKDDAMMAKIYFNRLVLGTIDFATIPVKYQAKVRQYGIEYVNAGKMTVEEYEMLFQEDFPTAE